MLNIQFNANKVAEERRKSQRFDFHLEVEYKLLNQQEDLRQNKCQNISIEGINLRLGHPLKKDDELKILLYFPNDPTPITLISKVIWCKESPLPTLPCYDIGMKHMKIGANDRMRFLCLFYEEMSVQNGQPEEDGNSKK